MEPSRFNELITEFERSPVSNEDLIDLIEYLKAEKRERGEQLLKDAKHAFETFLTDIEEDYGVCILHDCERLSIYNVDFEFCGINII